MQVLAVGKKLLSFDLWMQIKGFMAANPNVGGLEHEVMKYKNNDFCSGVNSDSTDHKSIIV